MKTNIPIYRAKKIDSDEYVKGLLSLKPTNPDYYNTDILIIENKLGKWKIDPLTLSIHFPDMLDKNNKRIFASLSEDGMGGDNVQYFIGNKKCISVARYVDRGFDYTDGELEVTGIYEGDSNE